MFKMKFELGSHVIEKRIWLCDGKKCSKKEERPYNMMMVLIISFRRGRIVELKCPHCGFRKKVVFYRGAWYGCNNFQE